MIKIFRAFMTLCIALFIFTTILLYVEEKNANTLPQKLEKHLPNILHYPADQTESAFIKTADGGVQHIAAKSIDNTELIKLIQTYLLKSAEQFRKGDFSMTERIYSADMPGVAQLKTAKPNDIKFEYRALKTGGQLYYSSEYPQYVSALHKWFNAQAKEHVNVDVGSHKQYYLSTSE